MTPSRVSDPDNAASPQATAAAVAERIAAIIGEVLGLGDEVRLDDDFFALGGHSLTASQVSSRIRKALGTDVPLSEFFERPNALALADYVVAHAASAGTTA